MPKTNRKIDAPVARKHSSIRLLDSNAAIKLPLAPNPVHMLQDFLKQQLAGEEIHGTGKVKPVVRRRAAG